MKKKAKIIVCVVLCVVFLLLLWWLAIYGIVYVQFGLRDKYPSLFYKGDKNVPQEDIVKIGNVYMRDLKMERASNDKESRYVYKYYILKKNKLPPQNLNENLLDYCGVFFDAQSEYDEIQFVIFKECPKMPWYWNNEGFFPDLELNYENEIATYWVDKDNISYRLRKNKKTVMEGSVTRKDGINFDTGN